MLAHTPHQSQPPDLSWSICLAKSRLHKNCTFFIYIFWFRNVKTWFSFKFMDITYVVFNIHCPDGPRKSLDVQDFFAKIKNVSQFVYVLSELLWATTRMLGQWPARGGVISQWSNAFYNLWYLYFRRRSTRQWILQEITTTENSTTFTWRHSQQFFGITVISNTAVIMLYCIMQGRL